MGSPLGAANFIFSVGCRKLKKVGKLIDLLIALILPCKSRHQHLYSVSLEADNT